MSSHIDPRLYGAGPHAQPLQQHHSQQQHHQQSTYTPPAPPQRLPRIHPGQPHGLPSLADTFPPQPQQQQQLPYYGLSAQPSPTIQLQYSPGGGPVISPEAHEQYHDDASSPGTGVNGDPNDPKRSRACEACRGLKVRCDQDPNDPTVPCKRCAKAKRQCIITAPSRKRQKKTDSRVAELEKKIDALTASLHAQDKDLLPPNGPYASETAKTSPSQSPYNANPPEKQESPARSYKATVWKQEPSNQGPAQISLGPSRSDLQSATGQKRRRSAAPRDNGTAQNSDQSMSNRNSVDGDALLPGHPGLDEQIDEIIDRKTANSVFDRYVAEMAQHLPAVAFNPGTKAADIRASKPILFLTILVAGSVGMTDLKMQQRLTEISMDVFADCIIRNGEKSLELVQALMVSTIWYRPPKRYEQMNFYQLTHIAAVMAIDVGMGKRLKHWRMAAAAPSEQMKGPRAILLSDTVEVRRTWLGCYFLCSNTSMSLRRPNLIRWTNYMDECLEMLETSAASLPSDKMLCQQVRLQHLNEEIGNQFSMDDPSATIAISDSKVQISLKAFERSLEDWARSVPKKIWCPTLQLSKYVSQLYMHEVALHNNHNVDDFRAPFTEESLKAASGQSEVLSPAHSSALSECLTSVHGIFDTFFSFDLVTVRALPIFYFVRIGYAVVVLIKIYFAVTAPNSEVGKIISKDNLQVEKYVDRLLEIFHTVAEENAFRPATKFLIILGKLRDWFQHQNKVENAALRDGAKGKQRDMNPQMGKAQQVQMMQKHQQQQLQHQQQQEQQRKQFQQYQQVQHEMQRQQQQQQQHHQQQQQQQQQSRYNNTPLHFLSEVATTNSQNPAALSAALQPQAAAPTWFAGQQQMGSSVGGVDMSGMDFDFMGMSSGFEQAMDMTLVPGTTDGDISSLFMGDPLFSFGMGMDGMDGNGLYGSGW